jgi:hypothetical protein
MIRKLATLGLLALISTTFLTACAQSSAKPYALTGDLTSAQKVRYTDDKGHFHPELVAQNKPLR